MRVGNPNTIREFAAPLAALALGLAACGGPNNGGLEGSAPTEDASAVDGRSDNEESLRQLEQGDLTGSVADTAVTGATGVDRDRWNDRVDVKRGEVEEGEVMHHDGEDGYSQDGEVAHSHENDGEDIVGQTGGQLEEWAENWVEKNPEEAAAVERTGYVCSIDDNLDPDWTRQQVGQLLGHVAGDTSIETYPVDYTYFDHKTEENANGQRHYNLYEEQCVFARQIIRSNDRPGWVLHQFETGSFNSAEFLRRYDSDRIMGKLKSQAP
jgi:hypothetical protein